MKKLMILMGWLLSSVTMFAQEGAQKSFMDDPFNDPMTPLYIVFAFVFIVLVLVIVVSVMLLRTVNLLIEQADRKNAAEKGVAYVAPQTVWTKISQKLNDSVPLEKEKDIDLGHEYDGIRELDNHLPPWWKWLFYATIAWSFVYLVVYHVSDSLPLQGEEYNQEVAQAEEQVRLYQATQPKATIDVNTLTYSNDAAIIENGKAVFISNNCGSCHRNDGGGNTIGPNLTDAYWIHGGDVKSVFNTVKDGAIDKGMPAWGKLLSPTEVRDVSFFIMSLQGSNPPDAKGPQGELVAPATVASDTLKARASL